MLSCKVNSIPWWLVAHRSSGLPSLMKIHLSLCSSPNLEAIIILVSNRVVLMAKTIERFFWVETIHHSAVSRHDASLLGTSWDPTHSLIPECYKSLHDTLIYQLLIRTHHPLLYIRWLDVFSTSHSTGVRYVSDPRCCVNKLTVRTVWLITMSRLLHSVKSPE